MCESRVHQHRQKASRLLCKNGVHPNRILYVRVSLQKMKQGEENNVNAIQANTTNSERDSNRSFDDVNAEK